MTFSNISRLLDSKERDTSVSTWTSTSFSQWNGAWPPEIDTHLAIFDLHLDDDFDRRTSRGSPFQDSLSHEEQQN